MQAQNDFGLHAKPSPSFAISPPPPRFFCGRWLKGRQTAAVLVDEFGAGASKRRLE